MSDAEHRTGLHDWGGVEHFEYAFRHLFSTLVQAVENEAHLHERGRRSVELRLRAMVEARLSLIEERKRNPQIAQEKIVRPLFVVGLPRTGSTFLQALLAQDPANIAPTTADFYFPAPLYTNGERGSDQRQARTREILSALGMYEPELQALHPWNDGQPEECHYAMELVGWSEQLAANWHVPSYNQLRREYDAAAFATHKLVLQQLQYGKSSKQYTLKSPGYLLRLEALFAAYPDALIVQTHRDPARVIPSLTAFLLALRKACSHSVPPGDKVARINLKAFAEGLLKVIELRQRPGLDAHFHDALFTDIVRDPIGSVRTIYQRFGLPLRDEAVRAMQRWLDDPANHTPRGRYTLTQFGLDEQSIDRHFGAYLSHYSIPHERSGI